MTNKYETIEEAVKAAYEALEEAEALADVSGESFYFSPAYGMGGTYDPEEDNEHTGSYWFPSSLSC